ncbi:MAG: diaminopimelate epimerase [Mucispirillum sp.]|nr:diaminopimelate epimerase [Mucispirillum sp.]
MSITFSKMSGNGNDIIVIDNRDGKYTPLYNKNFIEKVCARGLSVGADGLIFIENSDTADFKWQFFNSDGSVAEMCGNGARCAARYAFLENIAGMNMAFETLAGTIKAEIMANSEVKTMLTAPHSLELDKKVTACGQEYNIHSVNTGVPHAVVVCDNVSETDVFSLGRDIRYNKDFAVNGTNVNFIEVTGENSLKIRTYERGVEGETLACGTGCAASALIAIKKGLVKGPVRLLTSGGKTLTVYYDNNTVYLQGEGRRVYIGNLQEEAYNY